MQMHRTKSSFSRLSSKSRGRSKMNSLISYPSLPGFLLSFLGLIAVALSLVFMFLFAKRLGMFSRNKIAEWRRQYSPNFSQIPLQRSRHFIWTRANNSEPEVSNQSNYKLYNDLLPMTKQIFQQFTALTKSSGPVECLLLSTEPLTMKVIDKKILPVITAIETVELESFPQYYTKLPKIVVATYHQHETGTEILNHDKRIFQTIDCLIQPKLHIIGAEGKYRIYCARDGPVITAGQERR